MAAASCGLVSEWPKLTAFFYRSQLVGYEFRGQAGEGTVLRGPHRLEVGETLQEARQRGGHAFHRSSEQGGSYRLRTLHGRLIGYLSSESTSAHIASIDAGNVGCAAMTP